MQIQQNKPALAGNLIGASELQAVKISHEYFDIRQLDQTLHTEQLHQFNAPFLAYKLRLGPPPSPLKKGAQELFMRMRSLYIKLSSTHTTHQALETPVTKNLIDALSTTLYMDKILNERQGVQQV